MERLWIDTDQIVHLTGLVDEDGTAVTTATVTARVLDRSLAEVAGVSWPATLSHVGAGTYSGALSDAMTLTERERYYLEVVAVNGSTKSTWRQPYVSAYLS